MPIPPPNPESMCLVTGASSGIGMELARGLARRGHRLGLVARRVDGLEILATELRNEHGVEVHVYGCDLADQAQRTALIEKIESTGCAVEVLVNNAGFGWVGRFDSADYARQHQLIQVNAEAPVHLCAHFIPGMVARGRGGVLNLSSIAGFAPLPGMTTYSAAKAFILTFTNALHAELRGTGVAATVMAPGAVRTGFAEASEGTQIAARIPRFAWTDVRNVAEQGLRGLEHGRRTVVPGLLYQITSHITHHMPRGLLPRMNGF
jgi:short-subunit dehydrogenase